MSRIVYIISGLLWALLLLLQACAPEKGPSGISSPGSSSGQAERADTKASAGTASASSKAGTPAAAGGWEGEWEKSVSLARREGTVSVYAATTSVAARDPIIQALKEKYGINVQFIVGDSSGLVEKITRERRAGIYAVDAYFGGSTTFMDFLKPAGSLSSLDPVLILPEVVDGKYWLEGKLAFLDRDHSVLAFGINLGPQFMVNSEIVAPGEVKSVRDFLNPKWKGKIALHDPSVPGTGQKAMAVYGSALLGWDAVREMARQEPIIIRDQRIQTEWVARGKYPLGFGVSLGIFGELQRTGAPLLLGVPSDAVYTTASGSILALMDKAPNPNAARILINWVLSKEGQAATYRKMNVASRRLDVPTEGINPALLPKPDGKYYNPDAEEWLSKQPEYANEVKNIFRPLIGR